MVEHINEIKILLSILRKNIANNGRGIKDKRQELVGNFHTFAMSVDNIFRKTSSSGIIGGMAIVNRKSNRLSWIFQLSNA